jgi:hypothetical protein
MQCRFGEADPSEYEHQIASWEREPHAEVVSNVAIIVFGPFISLFQKWTAKERKRLCWLRAYNERADTHELEGGAGPSRSGLAAGNGKAITVLLWILVAIPNDPNTSDANRLTTQGLYLTKRAQSAAVIARREGDNEAEMALAGEQNGEFSVLSRVITL